ncbi:hypothetical protein NDU88_006516 [Pleurodeles waltl]|uniref:Uncharacterized protein n=1 Tax=Pleurodeles waltl TaxID=8319 RepID=A0AAV7TEH3_PLEWA|nr:hypothetical protein NDU88_006516 [Pleurodeles waltl]
MLAPASGAPNGRRREWGCLRGPRRWPSGPPHSGRLIPLADWNWIRQWGVQELRRCPPHLWPRQCGQWNVWCLVIPGAQPVLGIIRPNLRTLAFLPDSGWDLAPVGDLVPPALRSGEQSTMR